MSAKLILSAALIMFAAVFANFSFFANRNQIPRHLMNHTLLVNDNFYTESEIEQLLAETRKSAPIFSTTKEPAVFRTVEDNIGEAVPVDETKTGQERCPSLFVTDNTGKKCILPGRFDVGYHYLKTGGPESRKETADLLTSRTQPFLHYILDYKKNPLTKKLLESESMNKFARDVCPKHKPYPEPFQFNFVVQVPGQTVATHLDAVYFRRASRFHMPQWLLSVMAFSGLFKEDFVDQVQIVGYYHKWTDNRGGGFWFWNDPESRKPQIVWPTSRTGNSVDGSKVVHAADTYWPSRKPPFLPRAARNTLEYHNDKGKHMWEVKSDGAVIATYPEDDLRFTAVYRCRCFKDKEDAKQYHEDQKPGNAWNVSYVLDVLRKDLDSRGILSKDTQISRIDLAKLLATTYLKYPLSPDATVPFNPCSISLLDGFKFLKPVTDFLCTGVEK